MTGVSSLGQYLDQITRLKAQQQNITDLTTQISSGHKSQTLSGLGSEIISATRSRANVNSLNAYTTNITNANTRINLMQSSLKGVTSQATNILNSLTTAIQQGDYPDFASIKQLAGSVYKFVTDAMNGTDGERYLFGGADTSQPPISDTGLYDSALGDFVPDSTDLTNPPEVSSGIIGNWGDGTITTDQFIAAYHGTSDAVLGFSNALTTGTAGTTTVRVSDSAEFDYTNLANKTPMKDIVKLLGVLKSLPPVQYAPGALNDPTATTIAGDTLPNPPAAKQASFFKVVNDIAASLKTAIDGMQQTQFTLAQTQAQISLVKDDHTQQIATFKDIIGNVENSDTTEASAKLLQVQTQLQASYQVTAILSQLTLANYLPR